MWFQEAVKSAILPGRTLTGAQKLTPQRPLAEQQTNLHQDNHQTSIKPISRLTKPKKRN